MGKGCFISFEGGEGVGKSTQVRRLAERLRAEGIGVLQTREPGGTKGAEAIRDLLVKGDVDRWSPMAETLLHMAARADHVEKVIRPALNSGQWVISDRFLDSTRVYQGIVQGMGEDVILGLHRLALGDMLPDCTIMLDLPAEEGLKRAHGRNDGETRYEKMGAAFHRELRDAFLLLAKAEPDRCHVIDASQSVEVVADAVWKVVAPLIMGKGRSL